MNKKLNGRLLFSLVIGTAILGGGVHVLHGVQVKRSATTLLALANRAEKEERVEEFEQYLSRYIAFRPGDAEALIRYGRLLEDQAKDPKARRSGHGDL